MSTESYKELVTDMHKNAFDVATIKRCSVRMDVLQKEAKSLMQAARDRDVQHWDKDQLFNEMTFKATVVFELTDSVSEAFALFAKLADVSRDDAPLRLTIMAMELARNQMNMKGTQEMDALKRQVIGLEPADRPAKGMKEFETNAAAQEIVDFVKGHFDSDSLGNELVEAMWLAMQGVSGPQVAAQVVSMCTVTTYR